MLHRRAEYAQCGERASLFSALRPVVLGGAGWRTTLFPLANTCCLSMCPCVCAALLLFACSILTRVRFFVVSRDTAFFSLSLFLFPLPLTLYTGFASSFLAYASQGTRRTLARLSATSATSATLRSFAGRRGDFKNTARKESEKFTMKFHSH